MHMRGFPGSLASKESACNARDTSSIPGLGRATGEGIGLPEGLDFPGGSMVKNLPASAGDVGLIPGSGKTPERGNGNPLEYSYWENPMHRGAWRAAVCEVAKSLAQLSH